MKRNKKQKDEEQTYGCDYDAIVHWGSCNTIIHHGDLLDSRKQIIHLLLWYVYH